MEKTREFTGALIILLLLLLPVNVSADIEIDVPDLDFIDSISYQTEVMVNQNLQYAADDLEATIEPLVNRPVLTATLSQAQLLGSALPMLGASGHDGRLYLGLGLGASFISPYFDPDELEEYLGTIQPEDDPPLGGGLQLLRLEGGTPADKWLRGLSFHGNVGYAMVEYDIVTVSTTELLVAAGYSPFRTYSVKKNFQWAPLFIQLGVGGKILHGEINVPLDPIEQGFPLDPDGSGPLPEQTVTLLITPELTASVESFGVSLPLQVSTGLQIIQSIKLQLGAGAILGFSGTSVGVDGQAMVEPQGYLGDLIENSGPVIARGSIKGEPGQILTGYLWTTLSFDFGNLYLNIPLLFQPSNGVAAGLNLGVTL